MPARHLTVMLLVPTLAAFALAGVAGAGTAPRPVTITASAATSVLAGSSLGINGKVTPRLAGVRVTLQQRVGTGWRPLDAKAVRSNGSFSFVAHPRSVGQARFRVVTTVGTSYSGASPDVAVSVVEWTYLADVMVQPKVGDLGTEPIAAARVTYQHPVALDAGCYNAWGGDSWVDFSLGRRFVRFTATLGLDDAADSASTGSFKVIGDEKVLASGNLVSGTSTRVTVSLAGVGRLRLWSNVPDPTGAAGCGTSYTKVVFGDAQVLGPEIQYG